MREKVLSGASRNTAESGNQGRNSVKSGGKCGISDFFLMLVLETMGLNPTIARARESRELRESNEFKALHQRTPGHNRHRLGKSGVG